MNAVPKGATTTTPPQLVLCARVPDLFAAWSAIAGNRPGIRAHQGSVLEVGAEAVVSPANSFGWMRGGIDEMYSAVFPDIEQSVRGKILALHGGELPVGEAIIVATGAAKPQWMISAPTMRNPGERLAEDTVHPYLAARAVFQLWRDGRMDSGKPIRDHVSVIAMPGLGTGYGGVPPVTCARQVAVAWDEVFG